MTAAFSRLFAVLLASLALAGAADRPNILFIIADDWGWPHAGAYGAAEWIKTPAFDRLAAEGILFENAFTSNPKCSPCRASILTGRNSWQLKEGVNHFNRWPDGFVVYPDLLEKAGYHVGLTGKGWGPGSAKEAGFDHNPAGPDYDEFTLEPPTPEISKLDYARNFIEAFLPTVPEGTPFCFWLGGTEPHRAYEEGSGARAGKQPGDVEVPPYFPDHRVVRSDMLDYALEVEWFDSHVARVLDHLEKTGQLENTLIVMTSDHGMPFPRVKGQIYEEGFHLPLAIRWGARVKAGRKVKDFVNVRDFAPTFLEAAGVPRHSQFTGQSLMPVLDAEGSGYVDPERPKLMLVGKERHDLGRPNDAGYPVRALRDERYLYVHNYTPEAWPAGNPETGYRNVDGGATKDFLLGKFDKWYALSFGKRPANELYDIQEDPGCVHNLAAKPEHAARVQEMKALMEAKLKEEGDPRLTGNAAFFDTIEYTGSRAHAFDTWLENQTQPE